MPSRFSFQILGMYDLKRYLKSWRILIVVFVVLVGAFLAIGGQVSAQVDVGLEQAELIGLSGADPRLIAARIIQVALGLLGITAVGLLVYAGFIWMTAGGSEEKVTKAKNFMKNGVIGLIIIMSAFSIVTFVLSRLAPDKVSVPPSSGRRGIGGLAGGGGFPLGVIQFHYPDQGQTNVARNTNIMVTFVEPMLIESILHDNGTPDNPTDDVLNTKNISILKVDDDPATGPFVSARAQATDDGRSFVFDPVDLLGNSESNVMYRVVLGDGIMTAAGRAAFGNFGAYSWEFEVGTIIDLEPPNVVSVVPSLDSSHARNVVVQITFNEAMNPMTVSGAISRGFDNVAIRTSTGDMIDGRFVISNQYRTVEFISSDRCGTNSCGEEVYCLPGNEIINGYLRAASVSVQPPTALFPVDGITDAASNSLDGDIDGAAVGSPGDDYSWSFNTTNQIDLTAPVITSVSPGPYSTQVLLDAPLSASFSKYLQFSSINRQTVQLENAGNYTPTALVEGDHSRIIIKHEVFEEELTYTPVITSGLRDLYQNCYRPCVGP